MPYTDRFTATDDLIRHLATVIPSITDAQLQANYAGFLAVSAVTVFELAVKDIFNDFSARKDTAFGNFTSSHFSRLNGRIKLDDLRKDHIKAFGQTYLDDFKRISDLREAVVMRASRISMKGAYNDLITCRHQYVHEGNMTLTFTEVQTYFGHGKTLLECLDLAMH